MEAQRAADISAMEARHVADISAMQAQMQAMREHIERLTSVVQVNKYIIKYLFLDKLSNQNNLTLIFSD